MRSNRVCGPSRPADLLKALTMNDSQTEYALQPGKYSETRTMSVTFSHLRNREMKGHDVDAVVDYKRTGWSNTWQ